MKTLRFILIFSILLASIGILSAAPPVLSNVQASQRPGSQLVDISYDVSDPDSGIPYAMPPAPHS